MRRKNHKAADGGKTKAQAADARRTVRKTGYSALKNKGVSFFQRLSRHNKGSKEQGTAPASAAVPVSEDASPLYYIIHGPRADKAGTSNMLNAVKRMAA